MEDRFVGEAATLATTTSRSLGQIAKYLKGQDTSKQLRNFYRHLNVHCMFINDHVTRIRSALGPDHDLIVQVLQLFESLISPSLSKTTLSMGLEAYPRQTCLNQHWNDIRDADENAKLTFAQNCLVIGESMDSGVQRDFDDAFYLWEEDAVSRYPDDGGQLSVDERPPPKKSRSEPPYAIWSAAQSLFKALTGSTRCLCHPDELDARLCLATHRKSALSDSVDDGDFDIFLSMETFLQEAHVVTVRDTIVRIVEPHQTLLPPRKTDYKPMPIKKLCEQIHKMQKNKSQRLELKVEKGRLLKLRSEKSNFQIDRSKPPVSLQQLITQGSRHLTEKTKRILAVLMSYAVLHLHGTPWLQPSWDSSHILFFQTAALRIPLRPFIRTELSSSGDEGHDVCSSLREKLQVRDIDEIDPDDLDPDDFDPDDFDPEDLDPDDFEHPFPSLVTLAVILMELYLATPFKTLASDRNIDIQDDTGSLKRSLDVASIFEECKHEIPQNSQFYYAIQKCLDPRTWEDENTGQRLDDDALRVRMYQEVIRPLEDELCDGFNFITIEELDKIAESIDIASWGQMIQDQPDDASTGTVSPPPLFDGALPSRFQSLVSSSVPFQHPVMVPWNWNPSAMPGPFFSGLGSPPPIESEYTVARFYDDEKPSESHSQEELKKYLSWKKKYLDVYEKYIDPHIQSSSQHPVKIAILDSGVDETHCQVDTDNVKIKRNWTNKKFVKAVHDSDGHGTFVASLIVDFAPDAELYISKIADKDPSSPETIAEAIRHAVDDWNVDIISMSFGYPSKQIEGYSHLEDAILYAHSKNVLMFAAASNSGANLDRAYPARDPHVICVHATDSDGNRSKFSPTALHHDLNLATIGESIQSAWPVRLCDAITNSDCLQCKSGTSYATPIVVGMAAFLLQYARLHLRTEEAMMMKRQARMKDVLMRVAEKTQSSERRDGYNYVAMSLYEDNLFGKGKEFIDVTLRELLKR